MFDRLTVQARRVIGLARQEAGRLNHESIGTEHILLGLVHEGGGVADAVLKSFGIDSKTIRQEVEKLVKAGPSMVTMGQLPFTPSSKKVLELAFYGASDLGLDSFGRDPTELGREARTGHRPRSGDPAGHSDPLSPKPRQPGPPS